MAMNPTPGPGLLFSEYIDDKKKNYIGRNGKNEQKPYVPFCVLEDYWTESKIHDALKAARLFNFFPSSIRRRFLRVFSILVYTNNLNYFEYFSDRRLDDNHFPLNEPPNSGPTLGQLFGSINKWQWMFCPLIFDSELRDGPVLTCDHIIPVTGEEAISEGIEARVCSVVVDGSCYKLPSKIEIQTAHRVLVLKTYTGDRFQRLYEREVEALTILQREPSKHIVTYYGRFKQHNGTHYIYHLVLELVSGQNLERFMMEAPPQTTADILRFWRNFINVFQGLHQIHQYPLMSLEEKQDCLIIHEDLKPENILLEKGTSGLPFDFIPKIADFGYSHLRLVKPNEEDLGGVDLVGGKTYSAPEASHHARYQSKGQNRIFPAADIFSIGCVISDVAAWVASGPEGRKRYSKLRTDETNTIGEFNGSGYGGCFHNGIERLQAVDAMHKEIIAAPGREHDPVTPSIIEVVQDQMLSRKVDDRANANQLYLKLANVLDRADKDISMAGLTGTLANGVPNTTSPIPSSAMETCSPNGSHVLNGLTEDLSGLAVDSRNGSLSGTPTLYYKQAYEYRNANKLGRHVPPEDERAVQSLKENLHDRDHIFLIEDSRSLKKYTEQVQEAFSVLTYIAKAIDQNGLELGFTSDPARLVKDRHTTSLRNKFEHLKWEQEPGMFEDKLGKFIDEIVIRRLPQESYKWRLSRKPPKPLSIFIFTDGCWGLHGQDACGVQRPIKRLMRKIGDMSSRTQVMIQFIRFGDDPQGIQNLKFLDDFGKESDCDIVDTRPVSGDVYSMFMGSLDESVDAREETQA